MLLHSDTICKLVEEKTMARSEYPPFYPGILFKNHYEWGNTKNEAVAQGPVNPPIIALKSR